MHPELGAIPEGKGDVGPLPGAWLVGDCLLVGGLAASLGGLERALGGCAAPFSEAATSGALAVGGAAPGVTWTPVRTQLQTIRLCDPLLTHRAASAHAPLTVSCLGACRAPFRRGERSQLSVSGISAAIMPWAGSPFWPMAVLMGCFPAAAGDMMARCGGFTSVSILFCTQHCG